MVFDGLEAYGDAFKELATLRKSSIGLLNVILKFSRVGVMFSLFVYSSTVSHNP